MSGYTKYSFPQVLRNNLSNFVIRRELDERTFESKFTKWNYRFSKLPMPLSFFRGRDFFFKVERKVDGFLNGFFSKRRIVASANIEFNHRFRFTTREQWYPSGELHLRLPVYLRVLSCSEWCNYNVKMPISDNVRAIIVAVIEIRDGEPLRERIKIVNYFEVIKVVVDFDPEF